MKRVVRFINVVFFLLITLNASHAQWVHVFNPPRGAFALAASDGNLFSGSSGGVSRSTDNGTSWTQVDSGLTNTNVQALAVSGANLFAGTQWGGVFLSTNDGTTWTAVNAGLTNTLVYCFAFSAGGGGTNLFAGTGGGVFLSTNTGTSWTAVNTGLPSHWLPWLYALAISAYGGGTNLFAGTNGGGVFLSTNNGDLWTPIDSGLTNLDIWSLASRGGNVFVGTNGNGVFLSTNAGAYWTAVNTGLTNLSAHNLLVVGGNLFVGTYGGGVFLSTNDGKSWDTVNLGLTSTYIFDFAVCGTNLFASTEGGIWRRPLSEMITGVSPSSGRVPDRFGLQQNYPNPCNPSTRISYSVPIKVNVVLKIYDVLGREVATLVNEEKPAGDYAVQWNTEGMPSGVYFYRIHAGTFTATKKVLLLR